MRDGSNKFAHFVLVAVPVTVRQTGRAIYTATFLIPGLSREGVAVDTFVKERP